MLGFFCPSRTRPGLSEPLNLSLWSPEEEERGAALIMHQEWLRPCVSGVGEFHGGGMGEGGSLSLYGLPVWLFSSWRTHVAKVILRCVSDRRLAGLTRPCRRLTRLPGWRQKLFLICRLPQRTLRCYINVRLQEAVGQLKAVLSPQIPRSFIPLETFSTTALSTDCFSLKQDQNPVTFLFIKQGNSIHTSLQPPEGAVIINITCIQQCSNQEQQHGFQHAPGGLVSAGLHLSSSHNVFVCNWSYEDKRFLAAIRHTPELNKKEKKHKEKVHFRLWKLQIDS